MSAAVADTSMAAATPASASASAAASAAAPASRALQAARAQLPALSASLTSRFLANSAAARRMFLGNYARSDTASTAALPGATLEAKSQSVALLTKIAAEYRSVPAAAATTNGSAATPSASGVGMSSTALSRPARTVREEATGVLSYVSVEDAAEDDERTTLNQPQSVEQMIERLPAQQRAAAAAAAAGAGGVGTSTALVAMSAAASSASSSSSGAAGSQALVAAGNLTARQQLIQSKRDIDDVRPEWHAPWKLMRVISAHAGWVRAICVDHSNEWFATGSVDRTIKIFDLASGNLKLTLTGHISAIRGLCISKLTPYMFSIGEDKQVKCWSVSMHTHAEHQIDSSTSERIELPAQNADFFCLLVPCSVCGAGTWSKTK